MPVTKKIIFFSSVPIIIVGIYISLLGINFPFWDQWEVIPLLMKQKEGLLTFADFFAQHNEHRPLFPRLIWIALAGATHYNINAQLWINLLIVIGTFIFFINRSIKTWAKFNITVPPFTIPLISFLVFNLGQRESWLQGIQTIMFLEVACVVIGLFLLAENENWKKFFLASLLGIIASFSMASGMLYWFVGGLVLLISSPPRKNKLKIALWILTSILTIGFFLRNWMPTGHLNINYVITHILEWLIWVLNFLGAPLITHWSIAWVFGLLSVILYILIIGYTVRNDKWRELIPYFAIVLFILITAISISLGRIRMGLPQSTVSRYLTISVWYWATLLSLLPFLSITKIYHHALYISITLSLGVLAVIGGWRGYVSLYQRILPAYQMVTSGQPIPDDELIQISPLPDIVGDRLNFLCENKLSVCADIQYNIKP